MEFDYLISNNGAEVYDKNYNLLYAMPIDDESLYKIKSLEKYVKIFYRHPYVSKLITSINIYSNKIETYKKIRKYLEKNIDGCIVEYKFPKIKIINKKCNKINGIKIIQEREKIDDEKVCVIGDDINDMEMIKRYNGYSLNTAKSEVKLISSKNYNTLSDLIKELIKKEF